MERIKKVVPVRLHWLPYQHKAMVQIISIINTRTCIALFSPLGCSTCSEATIWISKLSVTKYRHIMFSHFTKCFSRHDCQCHVTLYYSRHPPPPTHFSSNASTFCLFILQYSVYSVQPFKWSASATAL
jgi:hypothetical protein